MNRIRVALAGLVLAASQPALALDIVFDYSHDTSGFFSASARSVLNAAAQVFEARLQDQLTAITSSGSNHFNVQFSDPTAGTLVTVNDFSVVANQLTVFVGASSLGAGTLGQGGPGGYGVSGTQAFLDNAVSRGQAGALVTPKTDFGPWGGALTFSNSANWYYDSNVSTTEGFSGYDFYSVAVHELGHMLGFGTAASFSNKVVGSNFTGSTSISLYGNAVPMADAGHWAGSVTSTVNGVSQQVAMSPSINNGQRKRFTELDFAALKDLGWQVSPVPEADTWAMMLVGIGLIGYRLRRKQGMRQYV
jgi:hypothetical protein